MAQEDVRVMEPGIQNETGEWQEVRKRRRGKDTQVRGKASEIPTGEKCKEMHEVPTGEEIIKAIQSWKLGKRTEKLDGLVEGSSIVKFWKGRVTVSKGKCKVVSHPGGGLGDILYNCLINLQEMKIGGRLVVQGGGNDLEVLKEKELDIWRAWMQKKDEYFPDVKMAIIPILPRRMAGNKFNSIRRGVNQKLRIMTFEDKSNTIEMGEEEGKWSRWMRPDGIHLNQLGISAATNGVNKWMASSLPERREGKK